MKIAHGTRSAVTWLTARQVRSAMPPEKQSSSPMKLPAAFRLWRPVFESMSSMIPLRMKKTSCTGASALCTMVSGAM